MARVKTRTRTISNAGQRRTLVCVASRKAIGELPTESLVEFDGLIELIADHDIATIQVQPQTFEIDVNGRICRYTPDVQYVRRDGTVGYREFKEDLANLPPELTSKLDAAARFFRRQGYEFSIRTADEIRSGFKIRNLKLLYRYQQWPVNGSLKAVLSEFLEQGPQELHDLHTHCGREAVGSIYKLIWDRWLGADLDSALLCSGTRVWRVPQ